MSSENHELVEMLRVELRTGFGLVTGAIGETNSRLDQTNQRLNRLDQKLDKRFDQIDQRFDDVNERIDQLSETIGGKLDGIASYLMVTDRNSDKLETRLYKLEGRVDKIERDRPA